jgi:hypothetical protein
MAGHALRILALFATVVAAASASAQQPHPLSLGANYTYVRTNVLPGSSCYSLNGGGVQAQIGWTTHLSGIADITVTHKGGITPDGYSLTQLTYTGGARYSPQVTASPVKLFGEIKVGGTNAFGTLSPSRSGIGGRSNAFAFEPGGGLQVRLGSRLSLIPVQADYLLTTFNNGDNNRQNDLRLSSGLLIRIGKLEKGR